MLNWIRVLLWLLPLRLRSIWVLLTVTSFGVLAAVTLMSISAIYSTALAESGLQHVLAITPANVLNAQILVDNRPMGPADYQALNSRVDQLIQDRLGFLLRQINRRGQTQPNLAFTYSSEPDRASLNSLLGRPFFLTHFEEHSQLVAGSWPKSAAEVSETGVVLETVVGERTAATMALEVGDQVFLFPFRADLSQRITLNITGIAIPTDPFEEYWLGVPFYFSLQDFEEKPLLPFYVREEAFFEGIGTSFSSLVGDFGWLLYMDTSVLDADSVQSTRDAFNGLEVDINKQVPRSYFLTLLENSRGTGLLATYQRDLMLARVPLFLFIALVLVVILYFLGLIMGLLARSRSDEASIFRSRGASLTQVSGLLTITEALMVLLATILGPFLALLLARVWLLDTINPAGNWSASSIGLSWEVFLWGALGGLLSFVILLISGANLSRLEILEFLRSRARPPSVPVLQRYYLDLLAVAVLAVLWWQIEQRGGFVDRATGVRSLEVDPTLLFLPAVVLLVAAFLMLRLLPALVRVLARLGSRTAPAWINLSLSRMARDPLPYGSLTVIVMMSAALGIFGAAFQTTLSQSQEDQALYDIGGDLVLTQIAFPASRERERQRELLAVPGIQSVSPLLRDRGNLLGDLPGSRTKVLAVDPVTLPEVAWFREDFTTPPRSLTELLIPLRLGDSGLPDLQGNLASGIPIPPEAEYMGIWVNTENLDTGFSGRSLKLNVRLLDAGGRYRNLSLGEFEAQRAANETVDGWMFMEAQIPTERVLLQLPLSLVSIFVSGSRFSRMPPGSISLDDVSTRGVGDADATVIEGFEQPGRWTLLPHDREEPDVLEFTAEAARTGRSGLSFSWVHALETLPRGVLIPPGPFPIPAIGGAQFQKGQRIRVKIGTQVVPMLIRETTQLFPTVENPSEPFLVVPLKAYQQYIQRLSGGVVGRPEEFWMSVEETADRDQAIAGLREILPSRARIRDRRAAVDLARRNPLAGGGWNGLTLLSITTLTTAVLIALATHAVVSIRAGRVELTVVRSLGFSRMQIFLGLAIERVVVSLLGLLMGGAVGYWLARWVLGLLDQNARGQAIVPPAIFATQGWIIAVSILCLVLASLAAIFLAVWSAGRLKPSDVLRSGE